MAHYKKRVDSNQKDIVRALVGKVGAKSVVILSAVGEGVPDLLVGVGNVNLLMEVKTDTGTLTDVQVEWHSGWCGQVAIVRNEQQALQLVDDILCTQQ